MCVEEFRRIRVPYQTVLLKLSMYRLEYLTLENQQVKVTETAIKMDIGASSLKTNVLEKLGRTKIMVMYILKYFIKDKGT